MEDLKKNTQDYENLVIERKFVSLIVAGLIVISLLIFLAGFFWGYRRASQDVQTGINKASFADQISYSALPLNNEQEEVTGDNIINQALTSVISEEPSLGSVNEQEDLQKDIIDNNKIKTGYYAELIGFGRLESAESFVNKLKNKGYEVVIKKRVSKTGNRKTVNWYQVVTSIYQDKQSLQKILNLIKKTEQLQGVKIRSI